MRSVCPEQVNGIDAWRLRTASDRSFCLEEIFPPVPKVESVVFNGFPNTNQALPSITTHASLLMTMRAWPKAKVESAREGKSE
jgi:hypothetical protein